MRGLNAVMVMATKQEVDAQPAKRRGENLVTEAAKGSVLGPTENITSITKLQSITLGT